MLSAALVNALAVTPVRSIKFASSPPVTRIFVIDPVATFSTLDTGAPLSKTCTVPGLTGLSRTATLSVGPSAISSSPATNSAVDDNSERSSNCSLARAASSRQPLLRREPHFSDRPIRSIHELKSTAQLPFAGEGLSSSQSEVLPPQKSGLLLFDNSSSKPCKTSRGRCDAYVR